MRVILRGKTYDITREDIEAKLRAISPKVEAKVKYFVEIGGKQFPVKQVIGEVLNLPRAGFASQDAYNILQRLGFEITEKH